MNTKNNLLYCVTFYDEDGNCFDQEIYASNEDDLMDILDSYEYDEEYLLTALANENLIQVKQ